MARSLWIVSCGLVVALVASVAVVALPGPPPVAVAFSRTITPGNGFTVNVTGMIMVQPANRSVSGTIRISVTNATGAVIASVNVTFADAANATGSATEDVVVPDALMVVHVTVDTVARNVAVSWDPITPRPERRP
jgi:hypothetical protein